MLSLVGTSGLVMKNMKLDYNSDKKSMHITFNINSNANCYRETENKNIWIINVWTSKAEGLKIMPFQNTDWSKLQEDLHKRSNLTEVEVKELLFALKRYKT